MDPVRIGLVGYGFGGRYFHAPLISSAPECDFVGVVTTSEERRALIAAEHPGLSTYDSLAAIAAAGAEAVGGEWDTPAPRFPAAPRKLSPHHCCNKGAVPGSRDLLGILGRGQSRARLSATSRESVRLGRRYDGPPTARRADPPGGAPDVSGVGEAEAWESGVDRYGQVIAAGR